MICLVIRCRAGEAHLWDKAEALQWYIHHSKLHSANKEKTNNERKTPLMIRSLVPVGNRTPSGFLKRLHCSPLHYVDCALLIRKWDKDNPSLNLFDLMMCKSVTRCSGASFCICICGKLTQPSDQVFTTALFLLTRPACVSPDCTRSPLKCLYLYGNSKPSWIITFITVKSSNCDTFSQNLNINVNAKLTGRYTQAIIYIYVHTHICIFIYVHTHICIYIACFFTK